MFEAKRARRNFSRLLPESPIFATDTAGWKDRARAAAGGVKIHVVIDNVGGALLGDVADLLAEGTGTVVNFGSLGGETSDIRLFAPRSLTLKGVSLGQWTQRRAEGRAADIALARRLALEPLPLFERRHRCRIVRRRGKRSSPACAPERQ